MSAFTKAVRNWLQRELDLKTPALEARWLRAELEERSWWLRAERAAWVLKKLTEEEKACSRSTRGAARSGACSRRACSSHRNRRAEQ